ncbi:MAG: lysophospholipid acyltransferase family protein [Pseudomonadota bacterium]
MDRLRTILFSIVFYGLSVPVVLTAPISALFGPKALRRHVHAWADVLYWSARLVGGIDIRIEGPIPEGQYLCAAKHESVYETIALVRVLEAPAIVMKQELASIPVWGWAARQYGMIIVDRSASAAALRNMMRDAKAALKEGRSVLIFPEGTRVPPGETPPLKAGFAGLYRMLGLPVVPLALDSGQVWPRRGSMHAGIVTLRFGEPIPPGLPREEIEARVHAAINALQTPAG